MKGEFKVFWEKLKKIIWPFWSKDPTGKTVYFEDTGEEMGVIRKVLRNSNGGIIGYEVEDKDTRKLIQFSSGTFENTERGLIFIPLWYAEAKDFIGELELKTRIHTWELSKGEIKKYVEGALSLREALERRLREIEEKRIEVRTHLTDVSEKRLLNEIGRREFAKEILEGRRKSKIFEINIQRCKELLIRFDSIPFLAKATKIEEEMPMLRESTHEIHEIPVNIAVIDKNENIVSVNEHFLKNLHYSEEKVKHKKIEEFIKNEGDFDSMELKEGNDMEFTFIDGDGEARKMIGRYCPMKNRTGNGIGILIFQEKLEEEELKKGFARRIPHDFFNPLCIAQGYLNLLGDEKYGELTPQQKKQIDGVLRGLSRIEKLVKETIKVEP